MSSKEGTALYPKTYNPLENKFTRLETKAIKNSTLSADGSYSLDVGEPFTLKVRIELSDGTVVMNPLTKPQRNALRKSYKLKD